MARETESIVNCKGNFFIRYLTTSDQQFLTWEKLQLLGIRARRHCFIIYEPLLQLSSTMEQEIAQIQQLYNRIPQQVMAVFSTALDEFSVPSQELQLQSSFDEEALHQLLLSLLAQQSLPRFQFLVEGTLLRGQLKSHILRHNLTAEQTLHIEFVLAFPEIDQHKAVKEDDWISSLASVPGPQGIIGVAASLYNGGIAFYDIGLQSIVKIQADEHPLKGLGLLPSSHENHYFCVSGGLGETLRIHLVNFAKGSETTLLSSNPHNGSINCISISPGADNHLATGGSNGEINIWQIPEGFETLGTNNSIKNKKKKKEVNLNVLPLLASGQAFEGTVECLNWVSNEEVVAGSSQHRMTVTNIAKMATTQTFLTRDSVVTSIDSNGSLILSAHEDGQVRLWDRREPSKPTSTFKGHSKWATSVRFNPSQPFCFASGSHDRTIKVWDTRSSFPLQNLQAQQEKVLSLEWLHTHLIASGGSDSQIHTHGSAN